MPTGRATAGRLSALTTMAMRMAGMVSAQAPVQIGTGLEWDAGADRGDDQRMPLLNPPHARRDAMTDAYQEPQPNGDDEGPCRAGRSPLHRRRWPDLRYERVRNG